MKLRPFVMRIVHCSGQFLVKLVLVFPGCISGQAAPSFHGPLAWKQSISLLESQNSELKAAVDFLRAAEMKKDVAKSGFLPHLTAELKWNESALTEPNRTGSLDLKRPYSRSLLLSQNLFAGFKDVSRYKQSLSEVEEAREKLRAVKSKLSAELRKSFAEMALASEILSQTGNIEQRRKDNLRIVQLRFENGREHRGSVLIFQAYLDEARFDQVEALSSKKIARAKLARILGLDEFVEFEIEGYPPNPKPPTSEPDFLKLALETPNYLQSVAREQAARLEVAATDSNHYPTLVFETELASEDENFWPKNEERWKLGLKLSIPIFSGGRDYGMSKISRSAAWQQEQIRENTLRSERARLQEAFGNFQMAVSKLRFNQSYKEAVTLRSEIAKKQYQNGLMGFLDWDWVEGDYVYRMKLYQAAKKELIQAEAAWEEAQGLSVIP